MPSPSLCQTSYKKGVWNHILPQRVSCPCWESIQHLSRLQGSTVNSTHQGWPQPGAGKQAQALLSSDRAYSCGIEGSAEPQEQHLHVYLQKDTSGRQCSRIQSSASVGGRNRHWETASVWKAQVDTPTGRANTLLRALSEPACTRWTGDSGLE